MACTFRLTIIFFAQTIQDTILYELQNDADAKIVKEPAPKYTRHEQIREITADGMVLQSEKHSGLDSQAQANQHRLVRKSNHYDRLAPASEIKEVMSDGRIIPASVDLNSASFLTDAANVSNPERLVCCLLGSSCSQCPLGFVRDDHGCAWKGNMRCRYKHEHEKDPGNCCALGSSCNYCPAGHKHDTACVAAGSFRCKAAEPDLSKAGECCFLGSSCTKCPHGATPDNHVCAGKGNYRCVMNDDCWFRCGWDGYCMSCETEAKEDRACCRKDHSSPICDLISDKHKASDRHVCVDAPIASSTSWITRLKYTAIEQKHKHIGLVTWSWLSWMNKLVYVNTKYGPGTLTDLNLKRIRFKVDGQFVSIEIYGLAFKIAAEGWFSFFGKSAGGKVDIKAPKPGGDLTLKFKLPRSHDHKDAKGNVILGIDSFADTLSLQIGLHLHGFPSAASGKLIDMVKNTVKDSLIDLANSHISVAATNALRILAAQKPSRDKNIQGLTSAGDCCSNFGRCHMCPFGYEHDRSACANQGDYRCLEHPRHELIGKCCALGTSCNSCPHGYYEDQKCASEGSMRCRSIPSCFAKCGNAAGWCLACEKGHACCDPENVETDPPECQEAHIRFPKEGYQCAKVSSGQPFLDSLRFYVPDQCIKAGPAEITIGRLAIGQVDLSRLRMDVVEDGLAITFENPEVSVSGTYGIVLGGDHSSNFYAKVLPGGHGAAIVKVKLRSDGTYEKANFNDCRLFVDFSLKIEHALLGALLDLVLAALRSFISRTIDEQVCGLLKLVLDGEFESSPPTPKPTCSGW